MFEEMLTGGWTPPSLIFGCCNDAAVYLRSVAHVQGSRVDTSTPSTSAHDVLLRFLLLDTLAHSNAGSRVV